MTKHGQTTSVPVPRWTRGRGGSSLHASPLSWTTTTAARGCIRVSRSPTGTMPRRRHVARSQPLSCDNRELRQSTAADCTSIIRELKSRAGRSELSLALSPLWVSNVVILIPRGVPPPYVTKTRDSLRRWWKGSWAWPGLNLRHI
jgi:hypothetical protein